MGLENLDKPIGAFDVWIFPQSHELGSRIRRYGKVILVTVLATVVIVSIVAYYEIESMGYASVQGIYIQMYGWSRCYSDTPSPHMNITTNGVLIFSRHPSWFGTFIRAVSFTLTVDLFNVGTFPLPYDAYFTPDHESIPWLRFAILNSTLAKALVGTNSSFVSLAMRGGATTLLYHQTVERLDSFHVIWKPSTFTIPPGCSDGYPP